MYLEITILVLSIVFVLLAWLVWRFVSRSRVKRSSGRPRRPSSDRPTPPSSDRPTPPSSDRPTGRSSRPASIKACHHRVDGLSGDESQKVITITAPPGYAVDRVESRKPRRSRRQEDPPVTKPRTAAASAERRGAFERHARGGRDPVDCTVYSPLEAQVGDCVLVQVFAHMPEKADEARFLAQEFDAETARRGVTALGTEITRGSKLSVELAIRDLKVDDSVQDMTWRGITQSVQFGVEIPSDFQPRTVIGKVLVAQDTVPIGQISFKLKVVAHGAVPDTNPSPVGEARRYENAFVCYASTDRTKVLPRVQMLTAVGIKFFQDILELDPGDRWAQKLFVHIDKSDVLFLFWSTAAKESEWVQREWRYGLQRRGDDFIRPVIIEGPPVPEPPPELAHLHFSDKILYFMP